MFDSFDAAAPAHLTLTLATAHRIAKQLRDAASDLRALDQITAEERGYVAAKLTAIARELDDL